MSFFRDILFAGERSLNGEIDEYILPFLLSASGTGTVHDADTGSGDQSVVYTTDSLPIDKNGDGKLTKSELKRMTSLEALVDKHSEITYLSWLIYCPNIERLPSLTSTGHWIGIWSGDCEYTNYTQLENICGKWLKCLCGSYHSFPALKRLVLPSFTHPTTDDGGTATNLTSCEIVDLGFNTDSIKSVYDYMPAKVDSDENPLGSLVIRCETVAGLSSNKTSFVGKYIFVPSTQVDAYKANENWTGVSSYIYAIGGTKWASEFGSTDPYADLTAEEKSWYTDLFPDLYKDWVAPSAD